MERIIREIAKLESVIFDDAWSEASLQETLQYDYNNALVREAGDTVTGYAVYSVIADTAELLRIAVDPEHRGQGIASSIMEEMLGKLDDSSADRIMLEVRSKNESAIALYEKFGFKNIAKRKNYYSNPTDDALIYEKTVL